MENSLTYLSEALPISGRASTLRTEFNRSLIVSLRYLLDACSEVIPPDFFSKATQRLADLKPELKFSGLLSTLHYDFFSAAEQQNIQKVNQIAARLSEDTYYIDKIDIISFSEVNDYYAPLVGERFADIGRESHFSHLSSEEFEKVKKVLQQAIEMYKKSFPDFYSEFEELVSEILVLKAEGLKNGTSTDVFGMIYKSSIFNCEKITDALDFIVHEQSHLYLHLLNTDDPIVLNPHEMHEAPLRVDKRPLMGIFHATFVISRMHYVLKKALSLNVIPEDEREYCEEQVLDYKKRCQSGREVLKKHAQMTPLGEALIASASKLV